MNSIWIIVALFGAFVSLAIAMSKRRSPAAWFVLGLLFPVIAIVAVLCLPHLAAPEESA